MSQHYASNKTKKRLVLISLIFSLFINANRTFEYLMEIFNSGNDHVNYLQWAYGLIMTFVISWSTIYFNLIVLPLAFPLQHKKSKILLSVIGNICLYALFMVMCFLVRKSLFIVNENGVSAYYFGWTVVYVFSFVIYSAMNYQQESLLEQKEKELLQTEKLRSELNEIKGVINPHFLFNSLNTLSALIQLDKTHAGKFVTHLSRIYRYILSSRDKDLITIEEELSFTNDYIQLIKIRHKDNFNVEVKIEPSKKHYLIPPMAIQLLLENAEKHNIFSRSKPLLISIYLEDDLLVVSHYLKERINKVNSTGNGLSSLSKRCRILLKQELVIIKDDKFTVKVPIKAF